MLLLAVLLLLLLVAPCLNCLEAVEKPRPVAFKLMCLLAITILWAWVMLVLNLPFKALMFLTLMRPSLVLFLVLWLKVAKDFLKVRCRLALLSFLISCLIWLDLVPSLPMIKERILVIILLLHFLSLMLGSVLVLRSEERRVGKECRSGWWADHEKKKEDKEIVRYDDHDMILV